MRWLLTIFILIYLPVMGLSQINVDQLVSCICEGQPVKAFSIQAEGSSGPFSFKWIGPSEYSSEEKEPDDFAIPGIYKLFIKTSYECGFLYKFELLDCVQLDSMGQHDFFDGAAYTTKDHHPIVLSGFSSNWNESTWMQSLPALIAKREWLSDTLDGCHLTALPFIPSKEKLREKRELRKKRSSLDCPNFAGPDRTICEGASVQLGDSCFLDFKSKYYESDFCYFWHPAAGLNHQYSKMPTAFPEKTTTYTLTLQSADGNLVGIDTVTVYVNRIELKEQKSRKICPGEIITLEPEFKKSGNYSFRWETGDTSRSIKVAPEFWTNYDLWIIDNDNGCNKEQSFQVRLYESVEDISVSKRTICNEIDTAFTQKKVFNKSNDCRWSEKYLYYFGGSQVHKYLWSNGDTTNQTRVQASGYHNLTITYDDGCIQKKGFEVRPCHNVEIIPSKGKDGNSILYAGVGYSAYRWQDGSTGQSHEIDTPGLYSVTVTDANGCTGVDRYFIDSYDYKVEDVFLVYYNLRQHTRTKYKFHLYVCANGAIEEEEKHVLEAEIIKAFRATLTSRKEVPIRIFWYCELPYVADWFKEMDRELEGGLFPMIIKQYKGKYYWCNGYGEKKRGQFSIKPYKFMLRDTHGYKRTYRQSQIKGIMPERGYSFVDRLRDLEQIVHGELSIGSIQNGEISYDEPIMDKLKIAFEPYPSRPAKPSKHPGFRIYVNGNMSRGYEKFRNGQKVNYQVHYNRTAIESTDSSFTDFEWRINDHPLSEYDSEFEYTVQGEKGHRRLINVVFKDLNKGEIISLKAGIEVQ